MQWRPFVVPLWNFLCGALRPLSSLVKTKNNAVRASHPNRIHKREFCLCRSRHFLTVFTDSPCGLSAVPVSQWQLTRLRRSAFASSRVGGCSPAKRDRFLRRPQRPGCPQRLHALGTASAIFLGRPAKPFGSAGSWLPLVCRRTSLSRSLAAQHSRLQ